MSQELEEDPEPPTLPHPDDEDDETPFAEKVLASNDVDFSSPATLDALDAHNEQDSAATHAMIAQAAAAAVEAAVDVDVTAVANAAALAVEEAVANASKGGTSGSGKSDDEVLTRSGTIAIGNKKRYRDDEDTSSGQTFTGADGEDDPSKKHADHLAARRMKDRQRYANMTAEQRQVYNAKRREQYHRQSENSRQKRRERERHRYHALTSTDAKDRNARRAKLERERYQKLTPQELELKNRRRRERAALARQKKEGTAPAATSDAEKSDVGSKVCKLFPQLASMFFCVVLLWVWCISHSRLHIHTLYLSSKGDSAAPEATTANNSSANGDVDEGMTADVVEKTVAEVVDEAVKNEVISI